MLHTAFITVSQALTPIMQALNLTPLHLVALALVLFIFVPVIKSALEE